MKLNESVALVTGGSQGIGLGIAEGLVREGVRVVLSARDRSNLEAAAKRLNEEGGEVAVSPGDVGDEHDAARMVRTAVDRWGRLDLLVNNAGIGHRGPVEETDIEIWDRMLRTNLRGPFLLTRECIPIMRRQGGGTIVNVSSLAGKNPVPNMAGYSATKWGLHGFSLSIMGELRKDNIRVVILSPGSTASQFSNRPEKRERMDSIVQPCDIARVLVEALKLPDRAMVSEIDIRPTLPVS